MKMTRKSTPYKAPGQRKNYAEGGSVGNKLKEFGRKMFGGDKAVDLKDKPNVRSAAIAADKAGGVGTKFTGEDGKTYRVVKSGKYGTAAPKKKKAAAKSTTPSSSPRPKQRQVGRSAGPGGVMPRRKQTAAERRATTEDRMGRPNKPASSTAASSGPPDRKGPRRKAAATGTVGNVGRSNAGVGGPSSAKERTMARVARGGTTGGGKAASRARKTEARAREKMTEEGFIVPGAAKRGFQNPKRRTK